MATTQSDFPASFRIEVVDALRGFAIMSIMLLHNIEHFDFYYFPEHLPVWMKTLDGKVWETLFFIFAGKSYAIFALLFGLTFFIQLNNQEKKGADFRTRFVWRLFLLLLFGIFNSVFYEGDILTIFAVTGLALVPVAKWSDRAVFITAAILIMQPFEMAKLLYIAMTPGYVPSEPVSNIYFSHIGEAMGSTSFWELVKGNMWNGRLAVIFWSWENGRFFQAPGLFMLGMLIGRRGYFLHTQRNDRFWKRALLIAACVFVPLYYLKLSVPHLGILSGAIPSMMLIAASWSNFAFMCILVSLFVLLYRMNAARRMLGLLAPFGRMSLTNYILQSIVGSFIYYGYGLALYRLTGATYSVLIGCALFAAQLAFCRFWLRTHGQGPLEKLWHRATWIDTSAGRKKAA